MKELFNIGDEVMISTCCDYCVNGKTYLDENYQTIGLIKDVFEFMGITFFEVNGKAYEAHELTKI